MRKFKNKQIINLAGAFGLVAGLGVPGYAAANENLASCRHIQSGEASWYGPGFNGKRTASGQIFNQNAMTAAHPKLPFGTVVTVVTEDGKSTQVTINDRGPYAKGRILDGSRAVASALGYRNAGHTDVDLYIC